MVVMVGYSVVSLPSRLVAPMMGSNTDAAAAADDDADEDEGDLSSDISINTEDWECGGGGGRECGCVWGCGGGGGGAGGGAPPPALSPTVPPSPTTPYSCPPPPPPPPPPPDMATVSGVASLGGVGGKVKRCG